MDLPPSAYNLQSLNYTLLCVLRYHLSNALPLSRLNKVHESMTLRSLFHRLSKVGKSTPCFVQRSALPLGSSKNSSIEIFFGSPSAWYRNQRLSKSLLLYTICLILKTRPARLCRLFRRSQERYHFPTS